MVQLKVACSQTHKDPTTSGRFPQPDHSISAFKDITKR